MIEIKCNKYVISIGYGRYTTNMGGTDKVILSQQRICNAHGFSYVYLYPVKKLNRFVKFNRSDVWGVLCDGKDKGLYYTEEILCALTLMERSGVYNHAVFIHHLKDVVISEMQKILDCYEGRVFFYIHDYMSVCPERGLVESNNHYCGSSFPDENKCADCCVYDKDRVESIKGCFQKYDNRICFIAPSEVAKDEWLKSFYWLKDKVIVILHQELVGQYAYNFGPIQENETLRIAFVGSQRGLKGWEWWKEAVYAAHNLGANIEFFHFGQTDEHIDFVKEVNVDFKLAKTSMVRALRNWKIHCAVLWSVWPETYSYTYFEAWASNAFIITNSQSGNIAVQAERNRNGIVAKDEYGLTAILSDESKLRELVNRYRTDGRPGPGELKDSEEFMEYIPKEPSKMNTANFEKHRVNGVVLRGLYFLDAVRWRYALKKEGNVNKCGYWNLE